MENNQLSGFHISGGGDGFYFSGGNSALGKDEEGGVEGFLHGWAGKIFWDGHVWCYVMCHVM